MGFLLPHLRCSWDPLLQRSVVVDYVDHMETPTMAETPISRPPFVATPRSDSPPVKATPAARMAGLHSAGRSVAPIAQQLHQTPIAQQHQTPIAQQLQTPAVGRGSHSTCGTGPGGSAGTRGTCSTGYSTGNGSSPSVEGTPAELDAQSLALAWRLQQEEQEALAFAIEAHSPMPGSGLHFRGGHGGTAPPSAAGMFHGAGGATGAGEAMEMDDDDDASLRLALRLQQEELQWHQIASQRTLSEAMGATPQQAGLQFGVLDDEQGGTDDDEP